MFNIQNKTINSLLWTSIERFSIQGFQFILSIIIARLVTPTDYGLIAILNVFLALAQTFIDSGFSNALIQKKNRTELDFSTVFYFNLVIGIAVYCILFFTSPYIASFYDEDLLSPIFKYAGLNLIITSFSLVHRTKLTIDLKFKEQAIISLIAMTLSGIIGVVLAYFGYGAWAIVSQTILNNLIACILYIITIKWHPLLAFSKDSFCNLFRFGSKLLFAGLINTLYLNLYSLIVGKWFSPSVLGYYNRASTMAQFASVNISGIVGRVLFPILCNKQDSYKDLVISYWKSVNLLSYLIFPLMFFICFVSEDFVLLILGEKWLFCYELLQILCLAYILTPIMLLSSQYFTSVGRSDFALKAEIWKKTVSIIILIVTFPLGIKWMCWGLVLYEITDFIIMTFYLKKTFPIITVKEHIKVFLPIIITCLTFSIANYIITKNIENGLLALIICLISTIIIYFIGSIMLKINGYTLLKNLLNSFSSH